MGVLAFLLLWYTRDTAIGARQTDYRYTTNTNASSIITYSTTVVYYRKRVRLLLQERQSMVIGMMITPLELLWILLCKALTMISRCRTGLGLKTPFLLLINTLQSL